MGQLVGVIVNILKYRSYSLLTADGCPKGTVEFAKLADRGSSRSMPKSKCNVPEATPYRLTQNGTGSRPSSAGEGKIDGMLLDNPQVVGGCHLVQRLPRTVEGHLPVDRTPNRTRFSARVHVVLVLCSI